MHVRGVYMRIANTAWVPSLMLEKRCNAAIHSAHRQNARNDFGTVLTPVQLLRRPSDCQHCCCRPQCHKNAHQKGNDIQSRPLHTHTLDPILGEHLPNSSSSISSCDAGFVTAKSIVMARRPYQHVLCVQAGLTPLATSLAEQRSVQTFLASTHNTHTKLRPAQKKALSVCEPCMNEQANNLSINQIICTVQGTHLGPTVKISAQ